MSITDLLHYYSFEDMLFELFNNKYVLEIRSEKNLYK